MALRQLFNSNKKEVWPKVVLKRLSLSLTHPYHCNKCPQRFHKIYEATEHYLSYHQNSNNLQGKEIKGETKIELEPIKVENPRDTRVRNREDEFPCKTCGEGFKSR